MKMIYNNKDRLGGYSLIEQRWLGSKEEQIEIASDLIASDPEIGVMILEKPCGWCGCPMNWHLPIFKPNKVMGSSWCQRKRNCIGWRFSRYPLWPEILASQESVKQDVEDFRELYKMVDERQVSYDV